LSAVIARTLSRVPRVPPVLRQLLLAVLALCVLASPALAAPPRSITEAPVRSVETARGEIGYRSVGKGPPLVMIMGLSGTMDAWPPSVVDQLARKRRVITFDNAGIRHSALGPLPLTITKMADKTAALIRALKLQRTDVLGWSMGGMIAQSLAARHPNLLRRLVLCATAPGDGHGTIPDPAALRELSNPAAAAGLLFPPGQDAITAAYIRDIAAYPRFMPQAPPDVSSLQFGASRSWLAGQDRSGRNPRRLELPVLIGGGALDRALPVANQRYLARVLPNARLKIYAGAAHGFFFQHRRDFVPRIQRFLGKPRR
jgi:pimeloyl-ACP methyl ester carboxylesterase